jgi:hypothetical protein
MTVDGASVDDRRRNMDSLDSIASFFEYLYRLSRLSPVETI